MHECIDLMNTISLFQLISALVENPASLCESSGIELFTVPDKISEEFNTLFGTLCRTNYDVVKQELSDWIDFDYLNSIVSSHFVFGERWMYILHTPIYCNF